VKTLLKKLKEDNGYALLTVLIIITMISILGVTLMGLTVNSMKFVNINQTAIVDKSSAEMGIEEAMAQVDRAMENINSLNANKVVYLDTVKSQVTSALDGIRSLGSYPYTLTHSTVNNGDTGMYVEKVTITAPIGTSGKNITKTVTVSTISNVFKYGAVSPGTLTLNGSSYIEGDVSVGGNVESSNYGRFMYNNTYYPVQTSYPAIKGNITVKGKYRAFYNNSWNDIAPTAANLNSYFSIVPKLRDTTLNIDTFNVTSLINAKSGILSTSNNLGTKQYSGTTSLSSSTFGDLTINNTGDLTINGNLVVTGNLTMNTGAKLTVNGSVRITGTAQLSGSIKLLNNNNYIYINGSTTIQNKLNLDGQMYINNAVSISDDLNTNGTVYAKTSALVQNMSNTSGGTLVLLCDGNIQISNNNQFNDKPKEINAFFYSNTTLEIYGVGSNIKIKGGIYGNPIILNAVKGTSSQSYFPGSFSAGYPGGWFGIGSYLLYFQNNQNSIDPTNSRLSIIYDKDLILNPPKGIPTNSGLIVKEIDTVYNN
jgi:type II secretory pathway pseudopilin PulG